MTDTKDIIFVNAIFFNRFRLPEIGSIILNDIVKKEYTSEIINFDIMMRENLIKIPEKMEEAIVIFSDYLIHLSAKIVQFYSICTTHALSVLIAKRVKELSPESIILFGGPHVTMSAKGNLLKYPHIDIVGMYEGETYFLDLIQAVHNGSSLNEVEGIAFRDSTGNVRVNKRVKSFKYSDKKAAYMHFDYKQYLNELENLGISKRNYDFQLEAGRGCPFDCSFCSSSVFWRRKFKAKKADTLINEMIFFNEKYGLRKFSVDHDMFTSNRKYIIDFCDKMKNINNKISWSCSSRIDVLDFDILDKMKDSRCTSIYVGIETGSKDMQVRIKKKLNLEKIIDLIKYAKKIGIEITTSFIYGFPLENEREFIETIKLIEKMFILNVDVIQLHRYFPLINTYEFSKIDELFLDETADFSIMTNREIYGKPIYDIIKNDSYIYSCFYSFKSKIRVKYINIEMLVLCFSMFYKVYGLAIKILIEKIGILKVYNLFRDEINEFHIKMYNRTIFEYYNGKYDNTYSHKLLKTILYESKKYVKDDLYAESIRYCDAFYNVMNSNHDIEKIIIFNHDMLNKSKEIDYKNNQMFVYKISKKDKHVAVEKMGYLDI